MLTQMIASIAYEKHDNPRKYFFVGFVGWFITPIKKARIFDGKIRVLYYLIDKRRILPPPSLPSKS